MVKSISFGLVLSAVMAASAQDKPAPSLDLTGSVQIQMQKALWDNTAKGGTDNNLDELFGRLNFGAKYKDEGFSSEVNIRAFPEGFGYEPLTGLVVKDSTDTISLGLQKTQIAKFQVEQAWTKYTWDAVDMRLGRFYTSLSKSITLGNYLDIDPGVAYQGKLAYHNATQFTLRTGMLTSDVLLGVGDAKLNTGYLRIYEQLAINKALNAGVGYRSNIFDGIHDENSILVQRFTALADYVVMPDLKVYAELGMFLKPKKVATGKDSTQTAFLLGLTVPTSGILTTLGAEMEYMGDRQAKDVKSGKIEDRPLVMNIYGDRKLGSRTKLMFAMASDMAGTSPGDMRFALRYSATLK